MWTPTLASSPLRCPPRGPKPPRGGSSEACARKQAGFTLIEVLIAVLVFSLGVLAMANLQANAIRLSTDAQQRAEATYLADQLLARMLVADRSTAASFAHKPVGTVQCAPTGDASTNPIVTEWLTEVTQAFPRASAAEQQIVVSGTQMDEVTVRLCWKNRENDTPHTLEVTNRVQWP